MNRIKRWVLGTLTVDELVEYFAEIGIILDFGFEKKRQPVRYAKNSRLYRVGK